MRHLLPLAALLLIAADPAARWPEFRGSRDGRADGNPPVTWSEKHNIRWKRPLPGKAWSSPVVWDGTIWLTNATEDGKKLSVVAVASDTGEVKLDRIVFNIATPAFAHAFNSHASCTPAVEDGRVYVHFGSAGTACVDTRSGTTLWERRDLPCDHFRGPGSSPILFENLLIVSFDGFDLQYVVALDKSTGKTVWRRDREIKFASDNGDVHKAYATVAIVPVNGEPLAICPAAEQTLALNPRTGEERWRITHGGMNGSARPVARNGLLYLTSGHTQMLLAVQPETGTPKAAPTIAWKTVKGIPTRPSLMLVDDLMFMVSDNGIASCFDAKTGDRRWQERLGTAGFSASPVSAAGRIYACDEAGTTHVLAVAPKFERLASNKLDAGCMASPAIIGDALILRTKTDLYRIEATGAAR